MTDQPEGISTESAQGRYTALAPDRDVYLERARDSAKYTVPSLIPPDGHTAHTKLYKPYQSVGARGMNNIASKLVLTLAPPSSPFFRLRPGTSVTKELEANPKLKTEVEKGLSDYEKLILDDMESNGDRTAFFEALKHLVCGGNILLNLATEGTRVYHLDRYVCLRDSMGNATEVVVQESFLWSTLPDEAKAVMDPTAGQGDGATKNIDVYTHVVRKAKQWFVYQEVKGVRIPGTDAQYPLDKCPWLPLRLVRISGENYGRGYIEEYIGDLMSLEVLTKAIVLGAAAASKVLFLVKPNGTTTIRDITDSDTGDVREGNADDVTILQMDKSADFRVAETVAAKIEQRMAQAFLLNSSVQRQAERVTAEEVRYMAQELEDALGGVYTVLTQEFQLPYIRRKMAVLQKSGVLPRLPKGMVKVSIVTGLDALGRGHERNKLVNFMETLKNAFGPEAVSQIVKPSEFAERLAMADGIDTAGLLITPEERAAATQDEQRNSMMQRVGPEAVKQLGTALTSQTENPQGDQPQ